MIKYITKFIKYIGYSISNTLNKNYSQYYYTNDRDVLQNDFDQIMQDMDTILKKTIYKGDDNK